MVLISLVDLGLFPLLPVSLLPLQFLDAFSQSPACPQNSIHSSIMSAHHAAIPKKCKVRPVYDGGNGVSHGHHLGINALCISNPFIHPINLAVSLDAATPGHQMK